MKQKRIFNLLKPVTPPPTAWDKVYDWILGKARIVVLITELIIAATFIAKVIEDTNAKNKEKEIERLTGELSFYAQELEPEFRRIQTKSSDYLLVWQNSTKYSSVINEIFSYIENPSTDINITASKDTISIIGYDELAPLQKLESSMKSSKTFTNVGIRDLSLEAKEVIEDKGKFVLEATISNFKREQIKNAD